MSLADAIAQLEGTLFPPASPQSLAALLERAEEDLAMPLPPDYIAFLKQTNGTYVNGLIIYPSDDYRADGFELPGIININLARRSHRKGLENAIVLGEFDDDFLIYRAAEDSFSRIDRLSLDSFESTPDLAQLITHLLQHMT
jgi:hypothetical protein